MKLRKKMDKTIEQIKEDRDVLFELANSYAGDKYGHIAVRLHQACNALLLEIENPLKKEEDA
jgi:hypothetical protein